MKKKIIIIVLMALVFNLSYAQQLPGDSLIADFKCLVKYLEETHPDPYSGFGGKVLFHKLAFDIEQNLKSGASKEEFSNTISTFLSALKDGHTRISSPATGRYTSNFQLPIELRAFPDGIMLVAVPEKHKGLLGSRLKSINNVSTDSLLKGIGKIKAVENLYGAYATLAYRITIYHMINQLIPGLTKDVTLELETNMKETVNLSLSYVNNAEYENIKKAYQPKWNKIDESRYMYFDFLDTEKQAMLFRLYSVMSKEVLLMMKQQNWPNMQRELDVMYKYTLKQDVPANQTEAIDKIPSISETFRKMLETMKQNKSKYLIIDLRDNGGGYTPIVPATLYQLYGDKYLTKDMEIHFYRLISPLYMQKIGSTLDEFNKKYETNYQYGDYDFSDEEQDNESIEKIRNDFVKNIFGGMTEPVADLNGQSIYSPEKVFVITNAYTFSAAFHYAFYLWKMGATVVGVPSKQAPNTFMESTGFKLPYTGLEGSISNSAQLFLPVNDRRAKIFYPDIMLTWNDYKKYNFDKYADLLFLLDSLKLSYSK